jgi:ABC-2 type transport system permease protein
MSSDSLAPPVPLGGNSVLTALHDAWVVTLRNLRRMTRIPEMVVFSSIQPIMFVLLFAFVFGGAIPVPGAGGTTAYREFLLPGIFVQTLAFTAATTSVGLADDLHKGLIDRFRSLPMARPAVLAGRTLADIVTNFLSIVVLVVTGVIIGFGFSAPVQDVILGVLILILFGYAFSWVFAFLGLLVSTPEAANSVGFIAVFPLTFVSSAFVPVDTLPAVLKAIAKVNPFTITVDALRHLWTGDPAGNNVWLAIIWALGIIAVFAPLAVARYRRASTAA